MISSAPPRSGLTLLEVLFAGLILVLAAIPAIELMASSSQGVVKARDRVVANFLGIAMVEEQKSRPVNDRGTVPEVAATDLTPFIPILDAFSNAHPDKGPLVREQLNKFRCRAAFSDAGGRPLVRSTVVWGESGADLSLAFEARLEAP